MKTKSLMVDRAGTSLCSAACKLVPASVMIAALFFPMMSFAVTVDWRSEAANGNWDGGTGCGESGSGASHWWYGAWSPNQSRGRPDCFGNHQIVFNNNSHLTMTLNGGSWYNANTIVFASGASSARAIGGSNGIDLRDSGAKVENNSSATHVFSTPFHLHNNTTELNPVSGDLTIHGDISRESGVWIDIFGNTAKGLRLFGVISGNSGMSVKQSSILIISNNNTFSGNLWAEKGRVRLEGHTNAMGAGSVNVGTNATLEINANQTWRPATLNLYGTGTNAFVGALRKITSSGDSTWPGSVVFQQSTLIRVDGGSLILSGVVSGGGVLSKIDAGTLELSGNNTYSGVTRISNGVVRISHANGFGTAAGNTRVISGAAAEIIGGIASPEPMLLNGTGISSAGAIRSISGNNSFTNTVSLEAGSSIGVDADTLTMSGVISGANTLTKVSSGTLALNGNNTYSGATTISAGLVTLGHGAGLGTTAAGTTISGGAALDLNGQTVSTEAITLNGHGISGTGGLINNSTTAASLSGTIALNTASAIGGTGQMTLSGVISGANLLTKVGTGTNILSGNNTFSVDSIISNGALRITHANGLGTTAGSNIVVSGAALELSGGITSAERLAINGTGTSSGGAIRNISGDNTLSGMIALGSASGIGVDANTLTLSGIISGSADWSKTGAGNLTLSGNNTFTGQFTYDGGGTLQVAGAHAGGLGAGTFVLNHASNLVDFFSGANRNYGRNTTISANTVLQLSSTTANSGRTYTLGTLALGAHTVTVQPGSNVTGDTATMVFGATTLSGTPTLNVAADSSLTLGAIGGAHAVVKTGAGRLNLGSASTFTGGISNRNGVVASTGDAASLGGGIFTLGHSSGSDNAHLTFSGGGRTHTNSFVVASGNSGVMSISNSANVSITLSGGLTLNKAVTLSAIGGGSSIINLSGAVSGSGDMNIISSGGTIILGADNSSYSGAVSIPAGTLRLANNSALTSANTVSMVSGTTLDLRNTLTIASLSGDGTVTKGAAGSTTLTISPSSGSTSFSGVLENGSGTLSLTKAGAGTQVFSGTSTYSGGTTISAGTLVISGSSASSAHTVSSGGTLRGAGTVGGLTIDGLVDPGSATNTVGTLTVASVNLGQNGKYVFDIDNVAGTPGTEWDLLNGSSGTITVDATSGNPFEIVLKGNPTGWDNSSGYSWRIIDGNSVSSYSADKFTVTTTEFIPSLGGGTFEVVSSGGDLYLEFTSGGGPDIEARGNGVAITNGDTTPSLADHTDFGDVATDGGTLIRTYTFTNAGIAAVGLGNISFSGGNSADFTVLNQLPDSLAAGGSTNINIEFDPGADGTRSTTLTFTNDVAGKSPYEFTIQGTGVTYNLAVFGNDVEITDGDSTPSLTDHTDFGNVGVNIDSLIRTYTITNTGTRVLGVGDVSISGTHSADFSVTSQPSSPIAVGGTTTFQVTFDPSATGVREATVSFTNTSSTGKSPYNYDIEGTGKGAGIGYGPATIERSVMLGNTLSTDTFSVTNVGMGTLSYAISTNAAWITVAPVSANLTPGNSQTHTNSYILTGLQAGVSNATISITDAGATNSPQSVNVQVTITNIPAPQSIAAEISGYEFVRLRAAEAAGRTVMIVHRQTNAPVDPDQGTSYNVGDNIGGGSRVLFKFTGSSTVSNLEHVVQSGSTNIYAFYAINNNHYSPVELIGGTTAVYVAGSIVETFSYTNAQTMASKSGGFGWTNNWSVAPGTNDFNVTTQLFTQITGYPAGGGNALTGRGSRILRDFTAITSGKIYVSFQLRIDNGGSSQFSGMSMFNNDSEVKFFGEGFSQVNQLTVGGSTGPNGRQLADNTDYTVIAMFDFTAGQFRAVLYTNATESIPTVEPVTWHVTEAGSATRINRIRLASNIGSRWDEVRIATNFYELVESDPPGAGLAVGPTNISVSVMKGSTGTGLFSVTNVGAATLHYTNYITYGAGSGWLTTAPVSASVGSGETRINTGTVSAVSLAAGTYVATNRVDGNQTNSAVEVVYTVAVTNIPDPTAVAAVVDGMEMIRVEWIGAGYDVLILHRDGEAPSADPTDNTAYNRDDSIGGGTVIYIGANQRHEHIVPPGSTNYYRVYSINNDHYSPGVAIVGTTGVYRVGEIVEVFAYTNNALLGSSTAGGQGWSGGWTTNTGVWTIKTNAGPVNFTNKENYPTNAANRIRLNNPGNGNAGRAIRNLATPITNGQIYVSAHLAYQFNGANKWAGINLLSNGNVVAFFGEISHADRMLGLSSFGSTNVSSSYNLNEFNLSTNNTYLVIGAYDFDTRVLKVASFFRTTVIPQTEPTTWDAYGTVPSGQIEIIDGIRLYAGSSDGGATVGDVYYDEIRVATSWDELFNKPATYEWDAGGGSNRDWSYAPNWTANVEPIAASNAFINGNYTGVVSQVGEVARDLYVGSTGTGTLLQTGGNLTVNSFTLGSNVGSRGTYQISSGSLVVSNGLFVGDDGRGDFVVDGLDANVMIVGDIQVSDSSANNLGLITHNAGTVTVANLRLGRLSATEGRYNMTGGVLSVSSDIYMADGNANATGRLDVSGGRIDVGNINVGRTGLGLLHVSGDALVNVIGANSDIVIGDLANNNRTNRLTISGGTVNVGDNIELGDASATFGSMLMAGGSLTVTGQVLAGDAASSTGMVFVTGGSVNIFESLIIGNSGLGHMEIHGGSVTASIVRLSDVTTGAGSTLLVGGGRLVAAGTTDFEIDFSGTATVTGGVLEAHDIDLGIQAGALATLNIGGSGAVIANNPFNVGFASGATGVVNQTGGSLSLVSGSAFFNIGATAGSFGFYSISNGTITTDHHFLLGSSDGSGTGVFHIIGGNSAITIGDASSEDFTMQSAAAELKLTFVNSAITPIQVQDDINVAGTLTVGHLGTIVDGTYLVATSLNGSAISGTFAATNWVGDYTGTVSYANNRITITFVTAQEIAILGTNGALIASGDTTPSLTDGTDYGSVNVLAASKTHTFFITNSGGLNLTISGVTTSGTGAADFEVLDWPAIVSPLSVSNLTIRFDPSVAGLRTAVVAVANNDSDESNYTFTLNGTGTEPVIAQYPTSISVTTMKGSSPASSIFTITNAGDGTLDFTISTNASWLSVSPVAGTLASGDGQSHTIAYNVVGLQAGVSNADVTVSSINAANSPQVVAVELTITNIPTPTVATATNDGPEMMRLAWTGAGFDVLIVHRDGAAPSAEPADSVGYSVGNAIGGGSVIYKGSGATLEHVVPPGSTNYYRFYSINNDHYAPALTRIWTTSVYRVGEIVEQFAYTNTVPVDGLGGGQGWTNNWVATAPNAGVDVVIVGDDLLGAYLNYWPAERANRITIKTTNSTTYGARRNFAGITTGKVYVAAMYRRQFNEGATDGKFSGIRLLQGTTEQAFVGERGTSGNDDIFGISSSAGAVHGAANSFQATTNYLIIGRFDLDTGIFAGTYYNTNQTIPNIEPDFLLLVTNAAVTLIDGIQLVSGATSGWNGETHFDEVRVAQSWYELLGIAPPDEPAIQVDPATINVTVMKGSTTSATFAVNNLGALSLLYTNYVAYGAGASGWLTVAPVNATVTNLGSRINTGSVAVAGIAVGSYTATNRVDGNQTNLAQFVSFNLTITNIPEPTAVSATTDGPEMVRLAWSSAYNVMIVHRDGAAPSADPTDNTLYNIDDAIGSGTVIFKGAGSSFEHIVPPGSENYYRFYAVNNDHYSPYVQDVATTETYRAGEIVEQFAYTNGVAVSGLGGGQGWTGNWAVSAPHAPVDIQITNSDFAAFQADWPAERANRLILRTTNSGSTYSASRNFSSVNSGKLYVAALYRRQFNEGATDVKFSGIRLLSNGVERAFFGHRGSGNDQFGASSGGNGSFSGAAESFPAGTDYLIIGRFDFDTKVLSAIYYESGDPVPSVEPLVYFSGVTNTGVIHVDGISLVAGTTSNLIGDVHFDEVRVADSWQALIKLGGAPYATNFNIGNTTNYVSDANVRAGTFPVVVTLRSEFGLETTNTIHPFYLPNFDLRTPGGVMIVTDHVFSAFSYQDSGRTLIASNNTHAAVAPSSVVLGVHTGQWSAIASNSALTINKAHLSNGTAIAFTVFDDDVSEPTVMNIISPASGASRSMHLTSNTTAVTASGSGTNITYTLRDGDLVSIGGGNPLIFYFGARDAGSGLARGNDTAATNSSLTIGHAVVSNVFNWDTTRSSSATDTLNASATNAWSWVGSFLSAEIDNLVTNTANGLGTNRVTLTWRDADSDRDNDQSTLYNQQHGWLVVNDDDTTAPNIQNFNIRSFPTSLGNYTVTVAQLLSGSGWGITGRVSDTGSGINVNGTETNQPNISPYYELWDHNGTLRHRQAFDNITFANGGATTLTSIDGLTNAVLASAPPGVWTARVVVADADNDRPNDRIIATNEFPFTVVFGDSQAGIAVSTMELNVTSYFGVVSGGGTWPNFFVTNIGIGSLIYDVNITYNSGFGWLSVAPSSSVTVGTGASQTHTVAVNAASLNPGTYTAVLSIPGNQTNGTRFITNRLTVIGYNVGEIVDPFTNAASGNLNASTGGTGWTNAWSTDPSGAFTVTAGNLTVPGNYPAAAGNKVCGDSSSELRAVRHFPAFTTGKVFMAVAAQKSDGNSDGYYGLSFMSNSAEVAYAGKLFNNGNFGLDLGGNGGSESSGFGVNGVDGYFFVGMYDFDNNTFYGRAYFGGTLPLTEPSWPVSKQPTTPIGSINGVRMAALTEGTVCFDEIRVARSWEGLLNQFSAEPTLHAVNLNFTDITTNSMTVNWTPGNGLSRIVVAREGSPVTFSPTDTVSYAANNNFTTATDIGGGNKVIYNGSGNSVPFIGLNIATRYYFAVYEYNGSGATADYLTNGTVLTGNRWTLSTEPSDSVVTFNAYTVSDTQISNVWTATGGSPTADGYLIARRNGSAVTFVPQDGVGYTNGQVVPNARLHLVVPGSAEYFLHSNLTSCATYHFAIYPFRWNGSAADTYNYQTNAPPVANATTTCEEPSVQASNIVFSAIGTNRITLSWQNGNGEQRVVVVRGTNAVNQDPVDGNTYTANSVFGSGSHLGNGNFVVYHSTGTTVTVTGLAPGATYHFRVYELNGVSGGTDYNTNTAVNNPRSTATASFGIVEDKFGYPTDWDNLSGKNLGTGWTNSWGTLDGLVEVGGFNMPAFGAYPADSGTRAGFMNSVTRRSAHRNFPGRTSGQLFLAIKVNIGDSQTSGYFGVNLLNGSATSSSSTTGFVGKASGVSGNKLSLEHNGTVRTNRISGSSGYTLNHGVGNDYLIVMMYDFDTKEFRARAYTPGQVAHADPSKENAWDVQMNNVNISRIDGVEIVGSGLGNCAFDHIRIGPSWEEVMWNLPDGWHEDQGPVPTLVYIGTNYNPAFHGQVITNLSDAELRSAGLIDFAVRWDTPSGMFLTNNTATNRNIGSPNARVSPNWDPLAVGVATNLFGLDRFFTNFFGFNNAGVVTTYQYSSFNITNIDFDVQYFVTVSAESAPSGSGTISAPNGGSWAAIPTNRAITINHPLRFYVYDDDTNMPVRGASSLMIMTNSAAAGFQNLEDNRRRFFVTDGSLRDAGMDVSIKVFDEYSGLQRAENGNPATNMNVTIPGLVTSNTANFVASRSTPVNNTTNTASSNIWSFSSSVFTFSAVSDLWGGDGTSLQGDDIEVMATVPDNDEDRVDDQTTLYDELFGYIRVIDDDSDRPVVGSDGLKIIGGSAVISSAVTTNLLAGWNFNDTSNRKAVNHGSGTMTDNLASTNNNTGSSINLVTGDAAGQDITIQGAGNVGRYIQFEVSTRFYQNLVMTFAAQRSGTGYDSNTISYSVNGGGFVNLETGWNPNTSFALKTVDFSSLPEVNDVNSVIVRITLNGGSGGNNRFDNLQFNAQPIRYFEITDHLLATASTSTPVMFSFNVYDTFSGIARNVSGTSNMHVSINGIATNNTAEFASSRSSSDTTASSATSIWSFTSFSYAQVGELYADGLSNRPVFASVSDADFDRQSDNLWLSNQFFGLYRVIDQDIHAPMTNNVLYANAQARPFMVITNGGAPAAAEVIRGSQTRRTGTGTNTLFRLSDADLANAGTIGLQFSFGARDIHTGISRGASGTTNDVMSFSVGNVIVGNIANYNPTLSSAQTATNQLLTNIWSFANGDFNDELITLFVTSGQHVVRVTIPDLDDDRPNDRSTLYSSQVGLLQVIDDDIVGPVIPFIETVGIPGGSTILYTSFEAAEGWPLQGSGNVWTNEITSGLATGIWYGTGFVNIGDPFDGVRKGGFTVTGVGQYFQLPPRENVEKLTLVARLSTGETNRQLAVERRDGNDWVSHGTNEVLTSEYQFLSWNIGYTGVATLRIVRVGTDGTPGINIDSVTLTEETVWVSTNQIMVNWAEAIDDFSGIDEYRVVAPAIGSSVPVSTNVGGSVGGSVTNNLFDITGHQGVITGFVFAIDNDNDRSNDRSMGNIASILVRVDTNPPPAVQHARATDTIDFVDLDIDESSEIKVTWSNFVSEARASGWRQTDEAPLSPWDTYIISYREIDESGDSVSGAITTELTKATSGWTNLLNSHMFTNMVISDLNFDANYAITIRGRDEAGNVGPMVTVTGITDRFIVTQGVNRVALDLEVFWTGPTNEMVFRDYDVLYVDSALGFRNALSNQWDLMQYTNRPVMFDTGSVSRVRPGELTNNTYRFYRVAKMGMWSTNRTVRSGSVEIYVTKALNLFPGENWHSLFFIPDTATVAYVFNTNLLPSADNFADATKITWFGSSYGGTTNQQGIATAVVWLADSGNWTWHIGGAGIANDKLVPINQGFLIELPTNASPQSLVLIGLLPTNEIIQEISGGTSASNAHHILSHHLPVRTTLANMGFMGSGFTRVGAQADEIRVLDQGGNGSLKNPKVRIRLTAGGTGWEYAGSYPGYPPASQYIIEPDDAVIIVRKNAAMMYWTNRVSFTPPTKNFLP